MPLTVVVPGWWPWAAAFFAGVAVVCGILFIRRPHPSLSRGWRVVLWAVRMAAALLLLACTLDWRRETSRQASEKPLLRVLIDRSASMAVRDTGVSRSRYEQATDRLASAVRPVWNDPARLETAFVGERFSMGDPATVRPDATRSALGRSLRENLEQGGQQTLGAVVLFSDGAASDPDELLAAARLYRTAGVPVYPWVTGTASQPPDLRIVSASLRQPSPSQAGVHLELALESPGHAGADTTLSVKFGGQTLYEQPVHLNGGRQTVAADFPSPYLGCNFYDVQLTALPGKTALDNNRARVACDLRRDPIRVLYMEGSAPSELSYLKDGLEADPDMSVTCLHLPGESSDGGIFAQSPTDGAADDRVFYDDQGREIPSVCHPTRGYPKTLAQLLQYDVVIDSDIVKEAFTPEQLANTVTFVERFGGGFVMVGGLTSFGSGGYETTVIDKLMPVEIANHSDPLMSSFDVNVTAVGLAHPIMQVGGSRAETDAAWTTGFPGFGGANYARRAKPGAFVLARTKASDASLNDLVLFAVQNIGRGRTMAFMTDTTTIWGDDFEKKWGQGGDTKYYRRFWNNIIRWLAADRIARKGGQAVIDVPATPVTPADVVPVRVAALTTAELTGLAVSVREGGLPPRAVPLQWDGARRDWEGSFVPKSPGDVVIEAAYQNAEGTPVVSRAGLTVRAASDETLAVAARPDLMAELARETGGVVLDDGNASKVLGALASHGVPVVWKRSVSVWDRWWLLLPLLLLIVFEWLLRRKVEPVGAVLQSSDRVLVK